MTEKGRAHAIDGRAKGADGECSCPGEPRREPCWAPGRVVQRGSRHGANGCGGAEGREVHLRGESARQEATGGRSGARTGDPLPPGRGDPARPGMLRTALSRGPPASEARQAMEAPPPGTSPAWLTLRFRLGPRQAARTGRLTAYQNREARWLPLKPAAHQAHPPGIPVAQSCQPRHLLRGSGESHQG